MKAEATKEMKKQIKKAWNFSYHFILTLIFFKFEWILATMSVAQGAESVSGTVCGVEWEVRLLEAKWTV